MTNPYNVPLEELDAVHVTDAELVEQQPLHDLRWAVGGALLHPFGDGMGDADGD